MQILLIEDDAQLSETLSITLRRSGFDVMVCGNGEDGLFAMRDRTADLVILDRMLPGMDGASVLHRARSEGIRTPVLFLSALGSVSDRIEGLNLGADDYLSKPFAYDELLARIRALLRRPVSFYSMEACTFADLSYDPSDRTLHCADRTCTLSGREGALLRLFLEHPGRVLERERILLRVWGADSDVESGNLDNYIHFLRRRLRSVKSRTLLETVRGLGYRLEDPT